MNNNRRRNFRPRSQKNNFRRRNGAISANGSGSFNNGNLNFNRNGSMNNPHNVEKAIQKLEKYDSDDSDHLKIKSALKEHLQNLEKTNSA